MKFELNISLSDDHRMNPTTILQAVSNVVLSWQMRPEKNPNGISIFLTDSPRKANTATKSYATVILLGNHRESVAHNVRISKNYFSALSDTIDSALT